MPPNDIGFDNLSRTGVDHRRSHGIRLLRGRISNHRITRIVDIEIRIIGRSILRYNRIFKTGSFKSFLPIKNTGFNLLPPLSGSCRVDIKYNRFGRFYQLAPFVFLYILRFRFQPPAMYKITGFHRLLFVIEINVRSRKKSDSPVCKTRSHRHLRQQYDIRCRFDCQGYRLGTFRNLGCQKSFYYNILRKSFHTSDPGQFFFHRSSQRNTIV